MIDISREPRHVSRPTDISQPATTDFTRALLAIHASLLLHARVLSQLKASDYTMNPCGPVKSSIASHTRHTLDHVEALLHAVQTGVVNFDHRERNTSVETDLTVALTALDDLLRRVHHAAMNPPTADATWAMSTIFTEGGAPARMLTSPVREAAFVLSHTIHHHAILGIMARAVGAILPERFGYAPSTPSLAEPSPCAR
ncbi:MAG: hypothetical protein IBJ18_10265 [Phycisphaerales bacterium]|nr:hypothetical protein [Phycisphaerales bacterium]